MQAYNFFTKMFGETDGVKRKDIEPDIPSSKSAVVDVKKPIYEPMRRRMHLPVD